MRRIKTKLIICYKVLFRHKHCVVLNLDDDNLVNLLTDKETDINVIYFGMQPYIYNKMIKDMASEIDDVDMICAKAEFEAKALEKKII